MRAYSLLNLIKCTLRAQLYVQKEYKANLILNILGNIFHIILEIMVIYLAVGNVRSIGRWSYAEILTFWGYFEILFGLHCVFDDGIGRIANGMCFSGELDKYLCRPYGILKQLICENIDFTGGVYVGCGVFIFLYGIKKAGVEITYAFVIVWLLYIFVSWVMQLSVVVFWGAVGFWLNEALPIMDFFSMFLQFGKYPLNIYGEPLSCILKFMTPIGIISYFPVCSLIKGKYYNVFTYCMIAGFFAIFALCVWRKGVRRYASVS